MSDDKVDKVDYYESFEIYKNATNRIIEKIRANRSFSFEDTPVDPRKLVAGQNIKDLKADGYTPKVKRLDFGVEQRKIKTKEERIQERYLIWCDSWAKEMNDLLEVEVKHTPYYIGEWIKLSNRLRTKVEEDRTKIGFSERHPLDSELGKRHYRLKEMKGQIQAEESRRQSAKAKEENRIRAERKKRKAERERVRSEKKKEEAKPFMLMIHSIFLQYYFYHYEVLGCDKLPLINNDMSGIKQRGKGNFQSRHIMNKVMQKCLTKFAGSKFKDVRINHLIDEMGETARFNQIASDLITHIYGEIDKITKNSDPNSYFRHYCKMYNPKMFLNGIEDLRTTLKEMKDHGATKEEQEGRNQSAAKSSQGQ